MRKRITRKIEISMLTCSDYPYLDLDYNGHTGIL